MQNVPNIVRERLKTANRAADLSHAQAHPDANLLTAFAEQSLAESERAVVLDHLSRCGDCRDIVALALPATEPVEAAIKKPATSWLTWPALRWGVVTAGILAIAALGVVRYQRRSENTASNSPTRFETSTKEAKNQPLASPVPATAEKENHTDKEKKSDNLPPPVAPVLADSLNATDVTANGSTRVPRAEALPAPMSPERRSGSPAVGGPLHHGPRIANQWQQQIEVQNPAAAASPSAKQQAAGALSGNREVPAVSETVEVQAQAAQMDTQSQNLVMLPIESGKSKDQPLAPSAVSEDNDEARVGKAKPAEPASPASGGVAPYAVIALASSPASGTSVAPAPRWSISSAGGLQRSFDRGTTWQVVDVNASPVDLASAASIQIVGKTSRAKVRKASSPTFRAVAADGKDVWAGGSGSALYHSLDAGDHWIRVMPAWAGAVLTGDIVSLEFADMSHGKVSTSTAEVWTTSDAGQTWQRQ
jgi:hypothetical protein